MKIIIPMSGIGKRFVEAGYKDPKPLIIVEDKPIIEHIINLFDKENDTYVFICNDMHLRETNMRDLLISLVPNCKIYEVSVNNRKGPVDAVLQIAQKEINDEDEIIISYCDYGTVWNYEEFKNKARIIQNQNPEIKFLVLTDEKEFLDQFTNDFNNVIFFEEVPRITKRMKNTVESLLDSRLKDILWFVSAIYIVSQTKYIISTSGNGEFWTILFRKNADNFYQYLNPKEYIYGIKNLAYEGPKNNYFLS